MLEINKLNVEVDNNLILNDISITFEPGIHILMGPNGVGKSSFAHALMGNPNYTVSGSAKLDGLNLLDLETHERARRGLFLSFQSPTPISGLSNFQFIKQCKKELITDVSSIVPALKKFKETAEQFRLPSDWDKRHLNVEASGGEKKKNEIIQMTMLEPKIAILDEPDSGLDVDAIRTLATIIKEYRNNHTDSIIIVITHYEKLIKDLLPDSVTILGKKGIVTKEGTELAENVFEKGFANYE